MVMESDSEIHIHPQNVFNSTSSCAAMAFACSVGMKRYTTFLAVSGGLYAAILATIAAFNGQWQVQVVAIPIYLTLRQLVGQEKKSKYKDIYQFGMVVHLSSICDNDCHHPSVDLLVL